jgi:hypothetical protein
MTFEGQYLTYAEYQALGGSAIGEMPFNLLEFEARKQIDEPTQFRLVGKTNIPQEVKLCEYKVINKIQEYAKVLEQNESNNITNESIDGYSVTYGTIEQIVKNKESELKDMIRTCLLGVIYENEHILYVGVK